MMTWPRASKTPQKWSRFSRMKAETAVRSMSTSTSRRSACSPPLMISTVMGLMAGIPIGRSASAMVAQLHVDDGVLECVRLQPHALLNEGTGRRFAVVLRPGTVVQPRFPAPVGLRSHTMFRIIGCILGVVSQAIGGRAPAGSAGYTIVAFRSHDPERNKTIIFTDGTGAGQGARHWTDGLDVVYGANQKNFPAEFVAHEYPFRIEQYTAHVDSGGPGFYRGGTGVVRDVRVLAPEVTILTRLNNRTFQPFGAA